MDSTILDLTVGDRIYIMSSTYCRTGVIVELDKGNGAVPDDRGIMVGPGSIDYERHFLIDDGFAFVYDTQYPIPANLFSSQMKAQKAKEQKIYTLKAVIANAQKELEALEKYNP